MSFSKKTIRRIKIVALLGFFIFLIGVVINIYIELNTHHDYSHLYNTLPTKEGEEYAPIQSDTQVPGMEPVAENDSLALFLNTETTEIAVYDKRNKEVWYSNPAARDQDSVANAFEKENMASQLFVKYYDEGKRENRYINYTNSVLENQFDIESIKDGVRITYRIGEASKVIDRIPAYISEERMAERILANLDADTGKKLKRRYVKSRKMTGFWQLVNDVRTSDLIAQDLYNMLLLVDYTDEDLAIDNEAAGVEQVMAETRFVSIPIEYTIVGDSLEAYIDAAQITETENMSIFSLDVLKFFGAASSEEDGYLVVPAGSGGLIEFNNGKTKDAAYLQYIYDNDPLMTWGAQAQSAETARLPIFGIKKERSAVLAYIAEGDAIAAINADVSGKTNSYNVAYPSFLLRGYDIVGVGTSTGSMTAMTVVEPKAYSGPIRLVYSFLAEDNPTYADMANKYRDSLESQSMLNKKNTETTLPFYVDVLGNIEREVNILGTSIYTVYPMTTYDQAGEIVAALTKSGVDNIQMRYKGWFNRGLNHTVPKKLKLNGNIGSKKDLNELDTILQEANGQLYPDVAFMTAPYRTKNYSKPKDAARWLDGYPAVTSFVYNRVTLYRGSNYYELFAYINTPIKIPGYVDSFLKSYDKLGMDAISLRDMGGFISSDKNRKLGITREISKNIVVEQINKFDDKFGSIMIEGGNEYALFAADHILSAPVTGAGYYIVDEEIPFYEMVVHGAVDYAGVPLNTSDIDFKAYEVKMAEYDIAPYFIWTYKSSEEMRFTGYNYLYSTQYQTWLEQAAAMHGRLKAVSDKVRNAKMTGHVIHRDGVRETRYDNNISVYVNYNDIPETVGSVTIPAKGYIVWGDGL